MSSQSSLPIPPTTFLGRAEVACRGSELVTGGIRVVVEPTYLPGHSRPFEGQFIFQYQIRITNESADVVTLLARHWRIIDGDGDCAEVSGAGVIGMQPRLSPGESFEYESFCPLPTHWGTMEGSYRFVREAAAGGIDDDGKGDKLEFEVPVARFFLVAPESAAD